MSITISEERPDSADAMQLITELDAYLAGHPYPQECRHAFSVDKLLREGVAFFVVRYENHPSRHPQPTPQPVWSLAGSLTYRWP